jgi:uncharacterized protein (DUF488 family)
MVPPLFTIGYEATTVGDVIDTLLQAGVSHLVDVRAVPQSRKPGFSRRQLEAGLMERGVRYTLLRGLGTPAAGRAAVRRGDVATMRSIFSKHITSDVAQSDLAHAVSIAREAPCCLLCFERDHTHCHRAIVAELITATTAQAVRHLAVPPKGTPA